jgi:hypothetical protein
MNRHSKPDTKRQEKGKGQDEEKQQKKKNTELAKPRTPYRMTVRAFEDVFTYAPVTLFPTRGKFSILAFAPDINCFEAFRKVIENGEASPHTRNITFPSPPSDPRKILDALSVELKEPDRLAIVIINPSWMGNYQDNGEYDLKVDGVRLNQLTGPLIGSLPHEQQRRVALLVLSQPGYHKTVVSPLLQQPCADPKKTTKQHATPLLPRRSIGSIEIDAIAFS